MIKDMKNEGYTDRNFLDEAKESSLYLKLL